MAYYWFFMLSIPVGFLLTSHFLHYKKRYFWFDYIAIFLLPAVTLILLYRAEGVHVLYIFLFWAFMGPFGESIIGRTYLKILGRHLWIYEKFPIASRTTSWLSVPFWAFVGLGIWATNQVINYYLK